jgi:hypothetical protein
MTYNLNGKKISDLEIDNPSPDLYDSVYFPIANGSNTKRLSLTQIKDIVNDGGDGSGGFMGQFVHGIRNDTPTGYLRCDGNEYPAEVYADFVSQYLLENKIPYKSLADYQTELDNNNDNCGYFGYDSTNNILRTPRLKNRVFIAQALTARDIAKYNQDQIVNITRSFEAIANGEGAFYNGSTVSKFNGGQWGTKINFDASRQVNTGDQVQPRHIQYPLFVCVSKLNEPATEAQYNEFIEGLNIKGNINGDNLTLNNLNTEAKQNILSIAMPLPQNTDPQKVGYIYNNAGTGPRTLPDGGTWLYLVIGFQQSSSAAFGSINVTNMGIAAGGTQVGTTSGNSNSCNLMAIRIN